MKSFFHNELLYSMIEMHRAQVSPLRVLAKFNKELYGNMWNPVSHTRTGRSLAAGYELFERVTRHYNKPEFGLTHTFVNGEEVEIHQKTVVRRTFCRLLHFKKEKAFNQPKMLVVAPMSGHYATLLRGTVEGLLPFYDVYVTDWENVREIPLSKGIFGLDDFIEYSIDFMEKLAPDLHVMAVCQPSVPVIAGIAAMSAEKSKALPASMTLIGGPIDTRKSPTGVNDFASEREMEWFERKVITRVPVNYAGFMRQVYPGFLQLTGFMAMNMRRHVGEHMKMFYHLIEGDGESAEDHRKFYNEYLAVMDLPAEFYLETVNAVFKDHLLPRGKLEYRGQKVDLSAIDKTGLLAIEGEKDDISGRGQTKAAIPLCTGLSDSQKYYHLQKGVGHYGAFHGRRFRGEIVPAIIEFTNKMGKAQTFVKQPKESATDAPAPKASVQKSDVAKAKVVVKNPIVSRPEKKMDVKQVTKPTAKKTKK